MSYATTTTLRDGRRERNRITCALPARTATAPDASGREAAARRQHDDFGGGERVLARAPSADQHIGADLRVGRLGRCQRVHLLHALELDLDLPPILVLEREGVGSDAGDRPAE